ncbi:glycerol-3-phosphate dehydrogenase 1 [Nucleospora cyclopteri]
MKLKVAVVGGGNWGTTIGKLVAEKIDQIVFEKTVILYIHDREIKFKDQKMLMSHAINFYKENPIYLPTIKLPENLQATADLSELQCIDVFIFCLPVEYINTISKLIIKSGAVGINLSKGLIELGSNLVTPSEYISEIFNIKCCSLMGPNIANEIAVKGLSETTIGFHTENQKKLFQTLFTKKYFRPKFINYTPIMEIYGAIKNVISISLGIIDQLTAKNYKSTHFRITSNTKGMVLRLGINEMIRFAELKEKKLSCNIFMESCGIGDLIVSSTSGRNYKSGKILADYLINKEKNPKNGDLNEFLQSQFNCQHLQGLITVKTFYKYILKNGNITEFPLITAIYKICNENLEIDEFITIISTLKM